MGAYRLYAVVPQLLGFIEDLTNWYIRLNRPRFWEEGQSEDKLAAYSTLFAVLDELSRIMAPFAPFLSEYLYRALAALSGRVATPASVHLCSFPDALPERQKPDLETAVGLMQRVILLGRQKREAEKINLRTPLSRLTIIGEAGEGMRLHSELTRYVMRELNVQEVLFDADDGAYIELLAKPNFPLLGKRLGKRMKTYQQHINALSPADIASLRRTGEVVIEGEVFTLQEIDVIQRPRPGANIISDANIAIDLDCVLNETLVRGGQAREIVRSIQRARKESGLKVSDRIRLRFTGAPTLLTAFAEHRDYICGETLAIEAVEDGLARQFEEDFDGVQFAFAIQPV